MLPVLTGCSAEQTFCTPFTTSAATDSISVTGSFGSAPTLSLNKPVVSKDIVTKVLNEGNGPTIVGEQMVKFDYTVFNGTSGASLGSSAYDKTTGGEVQFLKSGATVDMCHALTGVKQGSRIAVVLPAGLASNQDTAQLKKTDSVVFVMDINKVYLNQATGNVHASDSGMPTVVSAPKTGQPGVTIPKIAPPTVFKENVLIEGSGDKVVLGDTVTLNYSGFLWSSGDQFDSSWANGTPVQWPITEGKFVPGFIKALVGAKVGSKVLAVMPPSDAYGEQGNGTIPANSTLVFVIDILGVDKAAK